VIGVTELFTTSPPVCNTMSVKGRFTVLQLM